MPVQTMSMYVSKDDMIAALRADIERLTALLLKHGAHTYECAVPDSCTCGWDENRPAQQTE